MQPYQLADINQAIFHGKPPLTTIQPFQSLKDPIISRSSLNFRLHIYEEDVNMVTILSRSLEGSYETNLHYFNRLPHWMINLVYKEYREKLNNWIDYLFDKLSEFCDQDSSSVINWNIVSKGYLQHVLKGELTFEQKLWISVNVKKDRESEREFSGQLRDSLLPWINLDLYQKVKEKEENTRENSAYEEQKRKLLEGKIEDLDKVE